MRQTKETPKRPLKMQKYKPSPKSRKRACKKSTEVKLKRAVNSDTIFTMDFNDLRKIAIARNCTLAAPADFTKIVARINFKRSDYRRDGRRHQAPSPQYSNKSGHQLYEKQVTTTKGPVLAGKPFTTRNDRFLR